MSSISNKSALSVTNTRLVSGIPSATRKVKRFTSAGKLANELEGDDDGHIRVAVRCRPISEKELVDGHKSIIEFEQQNRIVVHDISATPSDQLGTKSGERQNYSHVFDFDKVFRCDSSQSEIYDQVCRSIVDSVLKGYNGTIFAYGQTGTGKTYTMEGGTRQPAAAAAVTNTTNHPQYGGHLEEPLIPEQSETSNNKKHSRNSNVSEKSKLGSRVESGSERNKVQQRLVRSSGGGGVRSKRKNSSEEGKKENFLVYDEQSAGVIPRAFEQIFNHVRSNIETQFLIRVSYLEIYQEELRDLLKRDKTMKLELHESPTVGVYVKNLTSFVCKSISEIERIMKVGNQNRMVGATDMNEHSSRSHAIFMITVEQQQKRSGTTTTTTSDKTHQSSRAIITTTYRSSNSNKEQEEQGQVEKSVIRVGKLNLVDLAGSERQRKTNSFGQRQKESIKINLSLSALGNVINSLMKIQTQQEGQQEKQSNSALTSSSSSNKTTKHDGIDNNNTTTSVVASNSSSSFIPYRDSKLTRLLQDSLGGNAKTLMIANIGPASYNYDETINTLNYASKAKCIRNKPRLNEDPKDALLRELQREISELRAKLKQAMENSKPMEAAKKDSSTNQPINQMQTSSEIESKEREEVEEEAVEEDEKHKRRNAEVERELNELRQKLASLESKLLNSGRTSVAQKFLRSSGSMSASSALVDHRALRDGGDGDDCKEVTELETLEPQLSLQGYTREQELELERSRAELANQVDREREIREELDRREEAELMALESFSSSQQEIDTKRRLVMQILLKIKELRQVVDRMQENYRLELDELEQLQYVLQKELKLKCLIMDNFIPNSHLDQLLPRMLYEEKSNSCQIEAIDLPSIVVDDARDGEQQQTSFCVLLDQSVELPQFWRSSERSFRPRSEFERVGETIDPNNIRFKYENLIEGTLDVPKFLQEEENQAVDNRRHKLESRLSSLNHHHHLEHSNNNSLRLSKIQALIEDALNERESDIVI